LFQADETLVSNRRNFSFKPQKLNVLPIETNQRYYQFKESIKRSQRYNNPYVADKLSATGICNTISHYKSPNKQAGGRYCR